MSDVQKIMPVTKVKRGLLDILKVMQEEDSTMGSRFLYTGFGVGYAGVLICWLKANANDP